MFTCPNCDHALEEARNPYGVHWACAACEGRAVSIVLLRHSHGEENVRNLLRATAQSGVALGKPCPLCRKAAHEVQADDGFAVDVCRPCNFVWFDWGEIEIRERSKPEKTPPAEGAATARELLSIEEVKRIGREANEFSWELSDWRTLAAVFGLPVEVDVQDLARPPLATWAVAGAVFATSVVAFSNLEQFVLWLGFVPAAPLRLGGMTLLSCFFLHGGWLHLLGNLYFLVTFGDNAEDWLGRRRFLLLLLGATLVGSAAHLAVNPSSIVPCIGASGGISGVITFYVLAFPQARLGMLLCLRPVRIPVWGWFGFWIAFQLIGLNHQFAGLSRVSVAAHLGGALAGVCAWALWRRRPASS